jgi:DNA-binding transcriptional ArsR family regulator
MKQVIMVSASEGSVHLSRRAASVDGSVATVALPFASVQIDAMETPQFNLSAFAEIAALVGDPARATMLAALMDGRALTAGELALAAGIMPQTASGHLARMLDAGLLAMARQGRNRYHRLASPSLARMLEGIMAVASRERRTPVVVGPRDAALRHARSCYDHLAGEIAVAIADAMVARGEVDLSPDGAALTDAGQALFARIGIDIVLPNGRRRNGTIFCRPCLDWSERRPHIAGFVGAALYRHCLDRSWLRRVEGSRALTITPPGHIAFERHFALRLRA